MMIYRGEGRAKGPPRDAKAPRTSNGGRQSPTLRPEDARGESHVTGAQQELARGAGRPGRGGGGDRRAHAQ